MGEFSKETTTEFFPRFRNYPSFTVVTSTYRSFDSTFTYSTSLSSLPLPITLTLTLSFTQPTTIFPFACLLSSRFNSFSLPVVSSSESTFDDQFLVFTVDLVILILRYQYQNLCRFEREESPSSSRYERSRSSSSLRETSKWSIWSRRRERRG